MEYLYERVAYLRGLCDGMDISSESKEGKLLIELIDVLGEFADAMVEMEEGQAELEEYVESIEEDLADLETDFYDLEEDEDCDCCYDEDEFEDGEFEEEEIDEEDHLEMTCPACGADVEISGEELADESLSIHCPECDNVLIDSVEGYHYED